MSVGGARLKTPTLRHTSHATVTHVLYVMTSTSRYLLYVLIIILKGERLLGLRNVTLLLSPPVVQRGHHVELLCFYDLQGSPLYSIKFYRGNHEFYRYSPQDNPVVKLFPFSGLQVDLSKSRGGSVVVEAVDFSMAGNITCEVSTEAPLFSTGTHTRALRVIELPRHPQRIQVESEDKELMAGDWLRASCISGPARPAPFLAFFINDEPVMTSNTRWNKSGFLEARTVTMETRLLSRHLATDQLIIKCTAVVADVYKETTSIMLHVVSASEPRHQRVRLSRASLPMFATFSSLHILLLCAASLLVCR